MLTTRVVNLRTDPYDVYIGRGSIFGNPYTHLPLKGTKANIQVGSREESIQRYADYFLDRWATDPDFKAGVESLKGKTLGCYCKPEACHGDLIVEWLNNDDR